MHARMFMFLRIFIRDVNSVFSGGHISIYPEIFPITLFSHLLLNSYLSIQTFTQLDSDHFYSASSIPLLYSEALPAQHVYCAGVSRATGNCGLRTCPKSLRGGESVSQSHDPPV